MSNSIINTSSNTYALQDIFSDKRVENISGNKEDIQALRNIMQRSLPSAVKAFFQTLWECIAHLKSWNESKLTVALNNANIGDRCTILETLSENLEKFDENTRDILGKFVTDAISSNYDKFIKNSARMCRILDATEKLPESLKQELKNSHVLYDEKFIKTRIQRCTEAKLTLKCGTNQKIKDWDAVVNGISNLNVKGSDINQKIKTWDDIANVIPRFSTKEQPYVKHYLKKSILASYKEATNSEENANKLLNVLRKLDYPGLTEKIEDQLGVANQIKLDPNASIGDKINALGKFTETPSSSDSFPIRPFAIDYIMRSMLADYREISKNPQLKERAMDIARKLPFDTSFQAKLTLALNAPDCYEQVQKINEFAINIHDNYDETSGEEIKDYDLTTTDKQPEFKGKYGERLPNLKKLLEKEELYNYVNGSSESSDKAVFDEFYKIFQKTNLCIDTIQRGLGATFRIGNQSIKVGPEYKIDDEDKDQWCERQTKELLKALTKQCIGKFPPSTSEELSKASNYLFNFIKRFHVSGNSMPGCIHNILENKFFNTTFADTLISTVIFHGQLFYSITLSLEIDENGIMYSTTQLCFDEKRCKNWIKESRPTLTENDINFLKHFAAAMVITTKTDLKDPDEKIDVSCYWRAGTTKEENISLDTPTNITNPNLHA